ncbi:MAG: transcriptional regulator [Gordonia sp. (in: high G+C Gram-positive bacteria)]|uniref:transcriptional regulator n=1 Tax=Gordonia sp. (in: high G+C Gram-positive bacteria) TaxID=84139 RepID=UPI0039E23EA5
MSQPRPPKRQRPALIVLTLVAAVVCLALAYWQWTRYESASGTFQNLGYALQWPAFAVAVIYAYRRFVALESDPQEQAKLAAGRETEIPDDLLPERPTLPSADALRDDLDATAVPDEEMAAYNAYLKKLNKVDRNPT